MKLSHIFKVILFLLLPGFIIAQYPSNPNKIRLGWQTTGDGLTFRGSGAPAFSPNSLANAWMYLDTTNMILYGYRNFAWVRLPSANNGLNMDGAYVQLGGTLGENTQVESSGNTFDLGKISGTSKAYFQTFGGNPYYAGIYSTTGTVEATSTVGNGGWNFEIDGAGHLSQMVGTGTGFYALYLGSLGSTKFTMDSARFKIQGLPDYATHALATAGTASNQLYTITNGRAIYLNTGTGTNVSPNILDNGTYVGILNSKPFSLGQWTTAGRPAGTSGYMGWNTTLTGIDWYNGTRWATGLESTFARGTFGSIFFANANGQITENNSSFFWDNTNGQLRIVSSSALSPDRGLLVRQTNSGIQGAPIQFEKNRSGGAAQNGDIIGAFTLRGYSGTQYLTDNSLFGGLITGTVTSTSVPTSIFFIAGSTAGNYNPQLLVHSGGNVGIGNFGSILTGSSIVAPSEKLHTIGNILAQGTLKTLSTGTGDIENITFKNSYNSGAKYKISWTDVSNSTTAQIYSVFDGTKVDLRIGSLYNSTYNSTDKFHFGGDGRLGISTITPNYILDATSTDAYGLPRGTVAQRPTIASSTTPFRYNTDSTALEYGESVGTWRQLATRAYARSLVSALPTTNIYTANGALTSNRTLTGGSYSLTFNAKTKIGADSSFVHDPSQDTTYIRGNIKQQNGYFRQFGTNTGRDFSNIFHMKSDAAYNVAGTSYNSPGTGQFNWFLLNDQRGYGEDGFGIKNENLHYGPGIGSYITLFTIRNSGQVEIGYPYVSRMTRVNSDTFSVESNYDVNPTVTNSSFYVVGKAAANRKVVSLSKFYIGQDSTFKFDPANDLLQLSQYGGGTKNATALSKTFSTLAGFATDGTVLNVEQKRDTTIYIDDADYDWSAAITTAQIARRFNRVIFWMTTTAAAGSDSDITLHTPDANLMQVEYLIHSVDEAGGFSNKIVFGTNNAVDSTNGLVTNYYPAAGDGVHIRAGLRSGVYKYRYSN